MYFILFVYLFVFSFLLFVFLFFMDSKVALNRFSTAVTVMWIFSISGLLKISL